MIEVARSTPEAEPRPDYRHRQAIEKAVPGETGVRASVGPSQATWGSGNTGLDTWSTTYQPRDLVQVASPPWAQNTSVDVPQALHELHTQN